MALALTKYFRINSSLYYRHLVRVHHQPFPTVLLLVLLGCHPLCPTKMCGKENFEVPEPLSHEKSDKSAPPSMTMMLMYA